jgi:glycerol-3-phosphate dehydrogenase
MNRSHLLSSIQADGQKGCDILVIGGGATGAGIAFDAASRGYRTVLLEQADFGKGTSSRSTKLLHGGVRYLAQGDIVLVVEALQERGIILKNAPNLTSNQEFVIPVYSWWEALKFTVGLMFYDLLAGRRSLGKSHFIRRETALQRLPLINPGGLKGGVVYHDGQFDDCRLLMALVRSVIEYGGAAINYCKVTGLLKTQAGKISGAVARDILSGKEFEIHASVVINATGVFADEILKMDHTVKKRTIRPSQGVHLVLDSSFLQSESAIMIPKTSDGRVLFAIPWYDKVVAGTTDTPVDAISLEPKALDEEIDFILQTAGNYLIRKPERKDILCVFAGLRPLAANPDNPAATREISRRHKISIAPSGLVSVEGGKWTIYRKMAEDAIDKAIRAGMLLRKNCRTDHLQVYGACEIDPHERLRIYGASSGEIREIMLSQPGMEKCIHQRLPYTKAEVAWICKNEMPVKLEDVLARRTRALFLDARASMEMAPAVAEIMAEELGLDETWKKSEIEDYNKLVENYLC